MRHFNSSYSEALLVPVHDRKLFFTFLKGDFEKEQERIEEMKQNSSSSKGKNQRRLTGDQVKQFAMQQQKKMT